MHFRFTVQRETSNLPPPFSKTLESGSPKNDKNPNEGKSSVPGTWGLREALDDPIPKDGVPAQGTPPLLQGYPWWTALRPPSTAAPFAKCPFSAPNLCRRAKQSLFPEWEAKGGCAHLRGCLWSPGHSYPIPSTPGCCSAAGARLLPHGHSQGQLQVPSSLQVLLSQLMPALCPPQTMAGAMPPAASTRDGGEEGWTSLAHCHHKMQAAPFFTAEG